MKVSRYFRCEWRWWMLLLLVGSFSYLGTVSRVSGARFKAGFSQVDITPPVGWRMSGYFYERFSTGIHDPLQAKVMVFEQGKTKAAFIFCDLIGIPLDISEPVRRRIQNRIDIPFEHVLVAATHSHTGPLYYGVLRDHFHRKAMEAHGKDKREGVAYKNILIERLVDAVVRADRSLQPMDLSVATAHQDSVSFNRRFHMKNGTVRFNPGKMNANIIKPAGPIDPDVPVLAFTPRKGGKVEGLFTTFSLHLDTVGGTEFSGDFPYYLEGSLRRHFGDQLISIFGAGPCGDINHIDVSHKRPQKGQGEALRIGIALATSIVKAIPEFQETKNLSLQVANRSVTVPFQVYGKEEVTSARKKMDTVAGGRMAFLDKVEVCKIVDLDDRGVSRVPLEVQVFALHKDVAIVGLPGEVFIDLGLRIKKESPFRHTMIVELCNDSIAYVPTRKAFKEGSYEVVNSRIKPGGGEAMVDTALDLLHDLK